MLYSNGGTVKVTINSGKITASFTNIPMVKQTGIDANSNPTFAAEGTATGTMVQQ
jgi:hypothetical protein